MPSTTRGCAIAVLRARLAVALDQQRTREVVGRADGGIRERGQVRERFLQIRPAGEIAPGDAHHLALAPLAQCRHGLGLSALTARESAR